MTDSDNREQIVHVGWQGARDARRMVQKLFDLGETADNIKEAIEQLKQGAEAELTVLLPRRLPSENPD